MDGRPRISFERLHLLDVDDRVTVLPSTPTFRRRPQRGDSLFVQVPEREEAAVVASGPGRDADNYSVYSSDGRGLESLARINRQGTIDLRFNFKDGYHRKFLPDESVLDSPGERSEGFEGYRTEETCPKLNIVIMLVGSRGDIQPYVSLGKSLQKDGHRVRVATHQTFEGFVRGQGLEFFNIGGDPQDLMSYMVKNPGLIPGFASLTNGDISRKRSMLKEMMHGCWSACIKPDASTHQPFVADAIIANPPSFAHVHCAEALGIPLLMTFTMPWTPTTAFPHPLVRITQTNASFGMSNYLSYVVADLLTWQGIGDIVNTLRTNTLGLPPLTLRTGPDFVDKLKVPWTYCISPALVPKPPDWKNNIDVVGFYFLDLATEYEPSPELAAFLSAGPPPIYVGFGSIVVDDPIALSNIVFEATAQAGVRALVSSGWGGLGGDSVPPHIFMLGNIPHDWLFEQNRVSAVVHHGGAGTTAIGLAKGRPTVIVPFFGDQAFWGDMVSRSGAGPRPIPKAELTAKKLRDAILFALTPEAKERAQQLADRVLVEDGVRSGTNSFYRHLSLDIMRCDLDPTKLAVWWSSQHCLKLSAFAAQVLADANLLTIDSLELHRTKEYNPKKEATIDAGDASANMKFRSITNSSSPSNQGTFTEKATSPGVPRNSLPTTSSLPTAIKDAFAVVQETTSATFSRSLSNVLPDAFPRGKSASTKTRSRALSAAAAGDRNRDSQAPASIAKGHNRTRSEGNTRSHNRALSVESAKPAAPKPALGLLRKAISLRVPGSKDAAQSPKKLRKPRPPPPPTIATAAKVLRKERPDPDADVAREAWKTAQNASSRAAQDAVREYRIAQGQQAVSWIHSTTEERMGVVRRFQQELGGAPARQLKRDRDREDLEAARDSKTNSLEAQEEEEDAVLGQENLKAKRKGKEGSGSGMGRFLGSIGSAVELSPKSGVGSFWRRRASSAASASPRRSPLSTTFVSEPQEM